MTLIHEPDLGTPAVANDHARDAHHRRSRGHGPAGHLGACAPPAEAGIDIPKLCATDSSKAFGSCRLCLVEVEGAGAPGLVHHPVRRRHGRAHPDTDKLHACAAA
jgi:formate dehydrogenase major subunit